MKVKIKAYAKINLMLDIINKRTDGYHDLFMIMQSIGIYDTVTVTENTSKKISVSCSNADIPLNASNIAWKAAEAFFSYTGRKNKGIEINIEKRIPQAAGLAGGSADGAAVITALNRIYKTDLSDDELCRIGIQVGADLPFCLIGGTFLAQGTGDVLNKVKPLRKCYIVLIKPEIDINTKKAYSMYDSYGKNHTPDKFGMLCAIQSRELTLIAEKMENVFEQFIDVPNRIEIKEIMKNNNALGVCMSGSGPSVFGIFADKKDAAKACTALKSFSGNVFLTAPVRSGCKIIE